MEERLGVVDVAILLEIRRESVLKQIRKGQLKATLVCGAGARGLVYKVYVCDLPEKAKAKYYKKVGKPVQNLERNDTGIVSYSAAPVVEYGMGSSFALMCKAETTFEEVAAEQRKKALWLKEMLFVWKHYRSKYKGDLQNADCSFLKRVKEEFNRDLNIHQLYRYQKAYNEYGEIGLVDFRGSKNKGKTNIDKDLWSVFEYLYLDENTKTATQCYDQVKIWAMVHRPQLSIPSYSAFNRMIKQIPQPIIEYYRNGQKAFTDNCEKYLTRMVEDLAPNDIWVADNHTLDVISQKDGSDCQHRMYLTAFIDARSRLLVGYNITDTPNSDSTLLALRDGILKHGKPKMIYVDNGREFLTTDIGGRGHRKKAKNQDVFGEIPPTILQLLEIKMINALPRNAKAKVIERWFREFTREFAKLFNTYVGSNPVARPEYTKYSVKSKNIVKDSELVSFMDRFIMGYINHKPQHGRGMNGKSPLQVWNENIIEKIVIQKDKLNLLLLRHSRPQTVAQNGVKLTIYNETIWYYEEKFAYEHMKKTRVYLRYDPKNLSTVRVYDLEDRFLAELPLDENAIGKYISDKEDIAEIMKDKRQMRKRVKAEYENRIYQGADRLNSYEIVNLAIDMNMENEFSNNALISEFGYTETQYKKVVGFGDSGPDIDEEFDLLKQMANNIKSKK